MPTSTPPDKKSNDTEAKNLETQEKVNPHANEEVNYKGCNGRCKDCEKQKRDAEKDWKGHSGH